MRHGKIMLLAIYAEQQREQSSILPVVKHTVITVSSNLTFMVSNSESLRL
jgi:hypothetical protein